MNKGVIAIVIIALLILGGVAFFIGGGSDKKSSEIDAFAQCLTAKNTTMYGAFWCPKCAATKKSFGGSFRYIKYVECDPRGENEQSELCLSKGIDKYDTWEFADGSRVVGTPTFSSLAGKSGCPAPGTKNGS